MSVDTAPSPVPVKQRRGEEAVLGFGVFGAVLSVLLVRFLVPRPVSMSDNGDGFRVLCGAGIPWRSGPEPFARLVYDVPGGTCEPTYLLSQSWLASAARRIGAHFGEHESLNLAVLGIVSSALIAAAITAVVLGLPGRRGVRLAVAAGLLLVVGDSAFFGYFASVLGEGAAFLGLLLVAGGLLLTARVGWWSYAGMAVTVLGGVVAINAKVQTLMILPLLVVAVLLVRPGGRRGLARWVPSLLVAAALGGLTYAAQQSVEPAKAPDGTLAARPGDDSREINMFNTVFLNIVDGKHDTQADLAALGLPPGFARYAGNGWWHPNPATLDPEYPRYRDKLSRHNVAGYFASHPGRTLEVLNRAASDLLTARPDYLGSFDASAGLPPHAQEYRMPVVSWLTGLFAPLGLFALVPLWLFVAWRGVRHRRAALGAVLGLLLAVAVGQFVLAALGDGIENVKHQAVALFATLLAVPLALLPRGAGRRDPVICSAKPTHP
ncbi:glycan biosynthesis hexose transferase WsfD [Amycolatopsis samaneae]|uniref:Dolichyl-phosphate-mannose-protein mannosyltransferase n=1 Tax=Amycolatopsis samaneae TaxID=664691 RepID=A0ABW5GF21_9PSEU